MKTIRVQNKMFTKAQKILIARFLILIVILLICSNFRIIIHDVVALIPAVTLILIPMGYAAALIEEDSKEYLFELQITNQELALVYIKDKDISKITRINLDDIKSFHVELTANNLAPKHPLRLSCFTDVTIKTKDHKLFHFTECSEVKCEYSFMLRLLTVAQDLPNFTFQIEGNSQTARKDIEHFAKYGKRLHWLKFSYLTFKELSFINKICFIFLFIISLFLLQIILLYLLNIP